MSPVPDPHTSHAATTVFHDSLWGKLTQVIPPHASRDDARLLAPLSIRFCPQQAPRLRQKPKDLLYRRAVAGKIWTQLSEKGVSPLPRIVFPASSWPCGHAFSQGFVDLVFRDDGAHSAALHSLRRFDVDIRGTLVFEQIAWCGAVPPLLYSVDCILIGQPGTAAWLMAAREDELSQKLEKISNSVGKTVAVTRAECKCCSGRIASPTAILRALFKSKAHVTQLLERVPPVVYLEDGESYPVLLSGVPGCDQSSPSLRASSSGAARAWRWLESSHVNAAATNALELVGDVAATA